MFVCLWKLNRNRLIYRPYTVEFSSVFKSPQLCLLEEFSEATAARSHLNKEFCTFDLCTCVPNQNYISSMGCFQVSTVMWTQLDKIVEVQQGCQFNRFLLCFSKALGQNWLWMKQFLEQEADSHTAVSMKCFVYSQCLVVCRLYSH